MIGSAADFPDAILAALLIAIDPAGLSGIRARGGAGPVREKWLSLALDLHGTRVVHRRITSACEEQRLLGGLDFASTLAAGKPVMEAGVLAGVNGGVLVLAMAERLPRPIAALIASVMDHRTVRIEREGFSAQLPTSFAMIALDEAQGDDEPMSPALADRLGLTVDLDGEARAIFAAAAPTPDLVAVGRARLPQTLIEPAMEEALAAIALAASRRSLRAGLFLVRAARGIAALRGAETVTAEDAAAAARLVLGGEALAAIVAENQPDAATPPPSPQAEQSQPEKDTAEGGDLKDVVLEAAAASLPAGLLDAIAMRSPMHRGERSSGAGAEGKATARGRPAGLLARPPYPGARLNLLATMRAAAPWQKLRAAERPDSPGRLRFRSSDFRYLRRRERRGVTAIFAVDASGSSAVARLAEAKGAIELLLAECYVRRDQVALVAFRSQSAEVLLEPTRSLLRAKRALAALPGGGGTPLALGIVAAMRVGLSATRNGQDAITVFLTDGRANIGIDGKPGREAAMADASVAARRFRASGLRGLVIDTARRPQPPLAELAGALGAEYVVLPSGGSESISRTLGDRMRDMALP